MLGVLGFIFGCPLRCPAQLGGRLATVCLPRLHPAVVWFALLLQTLLSCCGLHHTLRWSLSVVAGCLGNGRLCQQWACISVGAGCLGNGGRPSPTEHLRPSARGSFEIAVLFVPLGYPNSLSLQSPGLAHCPSLVQSQVQPSQVSGCRFNRSPGQARSVGITG